MKVLFHNDDKFKRKISNDGYHYIASHLGKGDLELVENHSNLNFIIGGHDHETISKVSSDNISEIPIFRVPIHKRFENAEGI